MNKKIKTIAVTTICTLFIISGLTTGLTIITPQKQPGQDYAIHKKSLQLRFHDLHIQQNPVYNELEIEGTNGILYEPGKPLLPLHTTALTLPFGTKIIDIQCTPQSIKNQVISQKIHPAPQPIKQGMDAITPQVVMDETIYTSDTYFPQNWFSLHTGGGLDTNGDHKTFITLRTYPIRYNSHQDNLMYTDHLDITIIYQTPSITPFPTNSDYDLVIITPSRLYDNSLHALMEHKNNIGVNTVIMTLRDIYANYSGVDKPEQIKYFIKDAIETWGIKYVLLVGGLDSLIYAKPRDDANQGTEDWHLPVRYTNLDDGPREPYDPGFISDLYYADIYDSEGNFSSWDSNGDGIFAKWGGFGGQDIIDFYPDVSVGRLACRNIWEVKIMTNKIMNYETGTADSSWYKKMVVVSGEAFDDPPTNYNEGELSTEKALSYMTDFEPVKLYSSNWETDPTHTPLTRNIIREVSAGCGHLFFEGHANPYSWTVHKPEDFDEYYGGINIYQYPLLTNGDKLPISVVVGCHNSQFNLSIVTSILDLSNSKHMWTYGVPVPECWSWWLTRKIGGGSIATIGCTALGPALIGEYGDVDGDGVTEPDCIEGYSSYMGIQFYKTCSENVDTLGEAHSGSIKKYLDTFPGMADQQDAKMAEQWALLGDPSLQIGGYP